MGYRRQGDRRRKEQGAGPGELRNYEAVISMGGCNHVDI